MKGDKLSLKKEEKEEAELQDVAQRSQDRNSASGSRSSHGIFEIKLSDSMLKDLWPYLEGVMLIHALTVWAAWPY